MFRRRISEEEKSMECVVCKHGETKPGTATVTLERGGTTLVIQDVPAEVCGNCGEAYVGEETARRLLKDAEEAAHAGVQVDVRRFVAA
jgi:YgiT-type zinc finger domain-containing protein